MMDIVEQLRKCANTIYHQDGYTFRLGLQNEAADEIERLREVRDQLQAINGAKDKEIAILRAEKHLAALKEGE
jgi:hypothetical protein